MSAWNLVKGLTEAGCLERQASLARSLGEAGLEAAVIVGVGEIHRLCGFWGRGVFDRVLLVKAGGEVVLASGGAAPAGCFASKYVRFEGDKIGTLVEDPLAEAVAALLPELSRMKRVGTDGLRAGLLPGMEMADVGGMLRKLRRRKLADEVEMLEAGVRGCEAAYEVARASIVPGLSEWDLYLEVQAAALAAVGEPIGELGNDFQAGDGGGGAARVRGMEAGEMLPLDLSVVVRGYSSDMCRTFCVGGKPTEPQREAHRRVVAALEFVEGSVRPGVSCRKLYHDVLKMLSDRRDWVFPHHLGHGIGLCAHEAPRLNPHWDDVFEEGDVFTAEPGLYAKELRGGVRLEQDYVVTAQGVRRLSGCSLEL